MEPILVIDDEKNIRLTVSQALEPLGVAVHTAINGEDGLKQLAATGFGLVFLDLKMPGIDGMEVLRQIMDHWPATRVIIITAHGTVALAVEAMKLGAADFIEKPFSPAQVRDVATAVRKREALNENEDLNCQDLIELTKRHISDRRFDQARRTARQAIAADPSRPEAYNLLGALLEIKGQGLEAQKFYRAALDIDPTFTPAAANLDRITSWQKFGKIDIGADKACGLQQSRAKEADDGQ